MQLFSFQKNAWAFGALLAMAWGGFIVIAGRPATADDAPAPTPAPTTAATTAPALAAEANDDDDDKSAPKTPDQKMQSRFPQPIRVGDLIGQPVETAMHETLGYVQHVVRAPDGKIQLIVPYRPWLGWAQFLEGYDTKPVAVPIEVVGSMGPALSSIDWDREAFAAAPKWTDIGATELSANEIIRIAIARE